MFRTKALDTFINLKQQAEEVAAKIPADMISHTTTSILLKDSRASFAIENELLPHKCNEQWGRKIAEVRKNPLDTENW